MLGFGDPPISKSSYGSWPLGTYHLVIGGDHGVFRALGVLGIYMDYLIKISHLSQLSPLHSKTLKNFDC